MSVRQDVNGPYMLGASISGLVAKRTCDGPLNDSAVFQLYLHRLVRQFHKKPASSVMSTDACAHDAHPQAGKQVANSAPDELHHGDHRPAENARKVCAQTNEII